MRIDPTDVSGALVDVMHERDRQRNGEAFTPEHDDAHAGGELARAASLYAHYSAHDALHAEAQRMRRLEIAPLGWPWAEGWWKPKDRRADLVKAAALILAEIERLDRAAAATQGAAA